MRSFGKLAIAALVSLATLPGAPAGAAGGSCWDAEGWNGSGWYQCGLSRSLGQGWLGEEASAEDTVTVIATVGRLESTAAPLDEVQDAAPQPSDAQKRPAIVQHFVPERLRPHASERSRSAHERVRGERVERTRSAAVPRVRASSNEGRSTTTAYRSSGNGGTSSIGRFSPPVF